MATNGQAIDIFQPDAQVGELKLWRPPAQVLAEAHEAAKELQKRIAGKKKPVIFNGEQYLENEDWQMLAHFYGYCPKIESTQPVEFGDVQGFKASAVLISEHTGLVVSRAESMCLNDEENWGPRPKYEWQKTLDAQGNPIFNQETGKYRGTKVQIGTVPTPLFQLMSMAETRASSKVMRLKLAWIVVLAGYRPTPAEEIDGSESPSSTIEPEPALPAEIKRKSPQPVPRAEAPAPAAPAVVAQPSPASPAPRPEPLQPASSAMPRPAPPQRSNGKVISEGQSRRFFAIWKGAGWNKEQVTDYLREIFGIEDDRLIPANRYEEACRWAQKGPRF